MADSVRWELGTTVSHYQNRFECHVLTLAGFAGIPRVDPGASPMLPQVRDAIAAYIRTPNLKQPIIVGHSLGGFLAVDLASHYPDLIGKLLIVDAYPFTMGVDPAMTPANAKSIASQIGSYISAMSQSDYETYARSGAATDNMVTSKADQRRLVDWALASDRKSVADAISEMLGADLRADLSKIRVPTMVLAAWRGGESEGATYVDRHLHPDDSAPGKQIEVEMSGRQSDRLREILAI